VRREEGARAAEGDGAGGPWGLGGSGVSVAAMRVACLGPEAGVEERRHAGGTWTWTGEGREAAVTRRLRAKVSRRHRRRGERRLTWRSWRLLAVVSVGGVVEARQGRWRRWRQPGDALEAMLGLGAVVGRLRREGRWMLQWLGWLWGGKGKRRGEKGRRVVVVCHGAAVRASGSSTRLLLRRQVPSQRDA